MKEEHEHDDEGFVVKVRGLPWSTTVDEILKFFSDCSINNGKAGIHMTMSREGRPSGEAYIEMDSEEDVEKAVKRDREHMGHRYIEVFKAKQSEMEWVVKRSGLNLENAMDDGCVRLRGLPFGCSKEEIAQFFTGLEILPNGISLPTDYTGRSTGEAYVQFVNKDVAEQALQKHKEKIGHRYIEIFRSSLSEVRASLGPKMRGGPIGSGSFNQRPAPYDRGSRFGGMNRFNNARGGNRGPDFDFGNSGGWNGSGNFMSRANNMMGMRGGGMGKMIGMGDGNFRGNNGNWGSNMEGSQIDLPSIHMRGLPFRATEQDIADFFRPVQPVDIHIIFENGGRASGEADVEFRTHEDAVRAMSKDRSNMSHRYIELFLNSNSPQNNMVGGRGMLGGGGGGAGGRMNNFGSGMGGGINGGGMSGGGMGGSGMDRVLGGGGMDRGMVGGGGLDRDMDRGMGGGIDRGIIGTGGNMNRGGIVGNMDRGMAGTGGGNLDRTLSGVMGGNNLMRGGNMGGSGGMGGMSSSNPIGNFGGGNMNSFGERRSGMSVGNFNSNARGFGNQMNSGKNFNY